MKRHLQAAILKGYLGLSTRLKTSSLDFPFTWLVFVTGFNNNTISLLFSCLSCYFHQNNGKNQGIDIFFSTGFPPWYIIIAISLSWLVLVIGFSSNRINTVSFSIYFPFYVIFIKKWQKKDCNFQHRAPIMECCWGTSASSCCKSWRGSCGHRS